MNTFFFPFTTLFLTATLLFASCQSKGSADSAAHKKLVADHATMAANHQTM